MEPTLEYIVIYAICLAAVLSFLALPGADDNLKPLERIDSLWLRRLVGVSALLLAPLILTLLCLLSIGAIVLLVLLRVLEWVGKTIAIDK